MLALLAQDGAATRAHLANWLWPNLDAKRARGNLRQRLFRLRRIAGVEIVVGEEVVRLDAALRVDLFDVETALASDIDARRGELLGTHSHDDNEALDAWVVVARARWRGKVNEVLARSAAALETQQRIAEALVVAQRLLADNPLAEHGHRRVMRLHHLRGDRSAALLALRQCRETLQRELGVAPGEETLRLGAAIESGVGLPAPARAPAPIAVLRPPHLIGRDAEWRRLAAVQQRNGVGLIEGEPGIGKTRLLADFCTARATATLRVSARHGDASLPYALLARLVRAVADGADSQTPAWPAWALAELARIAPELGDAAPGPLDPLRLQRAAEEALAQGGLQTIVVDDLQYADAASVEMLPALIEFRPGPCWLIALRAGEVPPATARWLAARGTHIERLALGPLDAAAVGQLLRSLALPGFDAPDVAQRLHRHAGGNPMFLLETLLAMLSDDGAGTAVVAEPAALPQPTSVMALMSRRLGQLSAPALKLARLAAIAGQDFTLDLASTVFDVAALDLLDAWQELEAAGVIADSAFVHDLMFEATLRSLPRPIARWLHGRVAAAIAAGAADASPAAPARLAGHWLEAGSHAQAAAAYFLAAQRAFAASRSADARTWFARAAEVFGRCGQSDDERRALNELVACELRQSGFAAARRAALRSRELARTADDRAWAHDRLADIALIAHDVANAEAEARAMLDAAPESSDGWIAFNGTRKLANALVLGGRHEEGLALFGSQPAWIDDHAREWNVDVWLSDHAVALDVADRWDEAAPAFDRALHAARTNHNVHVVYVALRNRSLGRFWRGDLAGSLADMEDALRSIDGCGDASVASSPRDAMRRAMVWREAGRHAEALTWLEGCLVALPCEESPFWHAHAEDQLALAYAAVGQFGRVQALVAAKPTCDQIEAGLTRAWARARCMRTAGMRQPAAAAKPYLGLRRWRLLNALEASRDSALDAAAVWSVCDAAAGEASRHGYAGIALHARLLAGAAAFRAGHRQRAESDLQTALATWSDGACHPTGMTSVEFMTSAAQLSADLGSGDRAAALRQSAVRRLLDVELGHVPEPYRESFLHRHPVHRGLVSAAALRTT